MVCRGCFSCPAPASRRGALHPTLGGISHSCSRQLRYFFATTEGTSGPCLVQGSALPSSPGRAGRLLRFRTESCPNTMHILLLRSGKMRAVKPVVCSHWASVGVCENVQVCKEQCFGYSWQRCSTASGWEQGGLARRRALLGMFYSSSGHSASPAQRGSILLPAPKQKLLKCQESVSLQLNSLDLRLGLNLSCITSV